MSDLPTDLTTDPPAARPAVVVLDVNETLSDMSPLGEAFQHVGLDAHEASTWFASLLRDGFALTALGENPAFATLARESLTVVVSGVPPPAGGREAAVEHVLAALADLSVHDDVGEGLRLLHEQGVRVVTLGNGAASTAQALLEGAGASSYVERTLSVADAPAWKPDARAYAHALTACGVGPEEAMLVAVHPWDVEGARRAGLRTGWINRSGIAFPSYFSRAEVEAPSLTGLASSWS